MFRPPIKSLIFAFVWLFGDLSTSASGHITWRRTYGGFGSDVGASVRQTSDGGYIVAGSTGSFGNGSGDIYVIRLDQFGEPIWSKTYGGIGVEQGVACRELPDGFIIAGSTATGTNGGYDMTLIRTDQVGVPLWEKNYGTEAWDLCRSLIVVPDGFVLGGLSYGSGYSNGAAYLVRTDLNGDTLWTRTLGSSMGTVCNGLAATADAGILIAGSSESSNGFDDGFIARCDLAGNVEWTNTIGGDSLDSFSSIVGSPAGGYVAIGVTNSFDVTQQIYLVGTTDLGQLNWFHLIGNSADAGASEIRGDHGGGFVFTGYNTLNLGERDMIFTVTDVDGFFQYGYNYGNGQPADGYSIDTTMDGGYVIAGWSEDYGPGFRSVYVVKTDTIGQTGSLDVDVYLDPTNLQEVSVRSSASIFPNPTNYTRQIRIAGVPSALCIVANAYDLAGRIVRSWSLAAGEREIGLLDMAPGSYQIVLTSDSKVLRSIHLIVQ
ncbi:MAG: T9SS type A sorting domain-containing protein [Flavobacteriales bacterium]|nr:T9SS type A sorting domain-containing protein [Flavobacteriales bacterium]